MAMADRHLKTAAERDDRQSLWVPVRRSKVRRDAL